MLERRETLRRRFDHLRRAVVLEPRGHDAIVGALLTPPVSSDAVAGVVFFNDVGYLGMCGHGLIGVVRTLEHLGRLSRGRGEIDTPAGTVRAEIESDGRVTIENVASYRHAADVEVEVPGMGRVTRRRRVRRQLVLPHGDRRAGDRRRERGCAHAIDHRDPHGAQGARRHRCRRCGDRSRGAVRRAGPLRRRQPQLRALSRRRVRPVAVRHWHERRRWRRCTRAARSRSASADVQESITGSTFTGWLTERGDALVPHISGRAFITAESTLRFDHRDPFRGGWRAQ